MTDWEFVFDGVVGYLKSPIWNYPIVTFIEKNCIVFDPEDENQLRYTEIHSEYSTLVEELLSCYLKDVGITEEQFVRACEAGSNSTATIADQSIFQHVWAAEDFELFKTLMVTKNIEMEQQAIKMIQQQQQGSVPTVVSSDKTPSKKKSKSTKKSEDELMKEAMKQSQKEYEKEKDRNREIKNMEKTLSLSKEESERILDLAEQELLNMERSVSLSMKLEKHVDKDKKETVASDKKTKPSQSSSRSSEKRSSEKGSSEKHSSTKPSSSKSGGKEPKSTKESSKPEKSSSKGDKGEKSSKEKTEQSSKKSSSSKEPTTPREGSKHEKHSSSKNEKTKQSSPMTIEPRVEEVKKPVESKPQAKEVTKSPTIEKVEQTKEAEKKETPMKAKETERKPTELMTSSEAANSWLASAKAEAAVVSSANNNYNNKDSWGMTEEELKEKTARFREQAYRIKHERLAKNLQQYNDQQPVQRPKSSRAAMRQVNKNAGLKSEDTTAASAPVKQAKAFSPALIQFLKAQQQQLQHS